MSDYTWIESLIWSYFYNRRKKDLVNMVEGVINRILDKPYGELNAGDDDTDVLMGAIVQQYGDYGTSPRFGWIYEEHKENVLEILFDLDDYFNKTLDDEED